MDLDSYSFQLTREEAAIIKRQLSRIVQIDQQIADMRSELEIECNALETAWQNAYRRNLLEKLKQGKEIKLNDFRVPPAIENDELKIILTEAYTVRVVKNE